MIDCIPHLSAASFFGSLTCQPPLPDVSPQQIPSLGRGLPQLLADRPPQLKFTGRLPLGGHCGAAGLIIFPLKAAPDGSAHYGILRCVKAHAETACARAAAIVATPTPGKKHQQQLPGAASPSCTSGGGRGAPTAGMWSHSGEPSLSDPTFPPQSSAGPRCRD